MKVIHLILSDVYAGMEQYVNELIAEQEKECDVILICTENISKKFKNKNVVDDVCCKARRTYGSWKLRCTSPASSQVHGPWPWHAQRIHHPPA